MKVSIKYKLNNIPHLNDFLDNWNHEMKIGDQLECVAFTSQHEYTALLEKYPFGLGYIFVVWKYVWHIMMPKIQMTRKLYFLLAGERHRSYSETEILGRICRAGFKIVQDEDNNGQLRIIAEKRSEPLERNDTCVSPILKQTRIGKDGKWIEVYKFRTMHSYAQYLQDYVFEKNKLNSSGKLAYDFRINIWGKILRPIWLDELPMLWNVMVKHDMKWVGVRPLTQHFYSLYTPEMQQLRIKVKPGMLPPFYYERKAPKGLDEIQASERRYVEGYLARPFRTDWRYFWGTVTNILLRMKLSK